MDVMSFPSNKMLPLSGAISFRIILPSVVLPQPDSPTRPRFSPGASARSTPSTARTKDRGRARKPPVTGKDFLIFFSSNNILDLDGLHQRARVRVLWFLQDFAGCPPLNDLTFGHDRDAIGHMRHHPQIMGDQ